MISFEKNMWKDEDTNDYQLSNMRLSEELEYWKAEAEKWRNYATSIYKSSYAAMLSLGDIMLEWDNITQS